MTHAQEDTTLKGTVICPGIGIGRVELVDTAVAIPHQYITAKGVEAEQHRYSQAVEEVRRHLRAHIQAIHHDTPGKARR